MTEFGGSSGAGNVFSIGTNGSGYQNLLSLSGTGFGGLTLGGTTLYGLTERGGSSGVGSVFSVGTNGSGYENLLAFTGAGGAYPGQAPNGGLTLSGTTLYGATSGGYSSNDGTVFSIGVNGSGYQNLLSFNGANGMIPNGPLTLSGTTLYGMTLAGGSSNVGTVFSVGTNGGSYRNLFSFNETNGIEPNGSLTLSGTTLYGMTSGGGSSGEGTLFTIGTNGSGCQDLLSFTGAGGAYPGESPYGSVTLSGKTLYGTTAFGAANGYGNVFALNIAPATIALSKASTATIITGGTATVGMTVSNSPTSGYNLNYTLSAAVQSGSATLGAISSGTGSLAPGGSQACTVPATSTTLGVTMISFTGSDPNSSNLSQTATATLTVLDHAAAAFTNSGTALTLNFGTLQLGSGTRAFSTRSRISPPRTVPAWPWNR